MKILKYLLYFVIAVFGVFALWNSLSPNEILISKSIEIKKDKATVYASLKDFKEFEKWSPWNKTDLDGKYATIGAGNQIGDKYQWEGDTVGKGEMTFVRATDDSLIRKLQFFAPWESIAEDIYTIEDLSNGSTKVTWINKGPLPFMMRAMGNLFIKPELEKQFESGLADLKTMLEAMPVAAAVDIKTEDIAEMNYLGIKVTCSVKDIAKNIGESFAELQAHMIKNNIEPTGPPMAIYYSYNPEGEAVFEATMPIAKPGKTTGKIIAGKVAAGKALCSTFIGPYEKTGDTHYAIDAYAKANNLKINEAIEIFENDPKTVKPEEIQTKIVYPIK